MLKSENPPIFRPQRIIIVTLVLATVCVYWPVSNHDFVGFDDELMVSGNKMVNAGLSQESLLWAFGLSPKHGTYWHPLTWVSHMLDCQVAGLEPGWHHLSNLMYHLANAVLLFYVLMFMTQRPWPSALVAALLALHPMNVEAVAWISSRKTLLSTTFLLLSLLCWIRYCRRRTWTAYLVSLLLYLSGLAAKPMLVSYPLLLLVLDFWPLERWQFPSVRKLLFLLAEKAPFAAAAGLSVVVTSSAVGQGSAMVPWVAVAPGLRLANALVSIPEYLGKFIAPRNLAVFYPYPDTVPWIQVGLATLLVLGLSLAAIMSWRRYPWLLSGWLWFLLSFAPVSGILQAGIWPRIADRWAYTPFIGLFIMLAWGLDEVWQHFAIRRTVLGLAAGLLLLLYAVLSFAQVQYWRNDDKLFGHALEVDADNAVALAGLGRSVLAEGRVGDAEALFKRAITLNPALAVAHDGAGLAALRLGRLAEAEKHLRTAMSIDPTRSATLNLATLLSQSGRNAEAIAVLQESLAVRPATAELHNIWGVALARAGQLGEAQRHFERALELEPENAAAQANLESCRRQPAEPSP